MSLLNGGGKNNTKKGAKGAKPAAPGAKSFIKPGKTAANIAKKPIKTGGARGS